MWGTVPILVHIYYRDLATITVRMSTVVAGEIATEEFALADTFESLPDLIVEAERAIGHGKEARMPLLWADGTSPRKVARSLRDDPSTERVSLIAAVDDKQLFRVRWSENVRDALDHILNDHASLLKVSADNRSWRFQVFYPDRSEASMTKGNGVRFKVNRVGPLETESAIKYGLTEKQHEALRLGWKYGYFTVPRRIGIEELSNHLGITHQSASERLRRGQASLIQEAFGLQQPP